jgi:hypothetical protein
MALIRKNDEFLVMPLKTILGVMGLVNHTGTPKLWAIVPKNGRKRKKDKFFIIPLENVQTVIFVVNLHGTPKLCAIVLGHASQKYTECHGPGKSPRDTKTMGNSSQKWP